jgi:hypothetical protein
LSYPCLKVVVNFQQDNMWIFLFLHSIWLPRFLAFVVRVYGSHIPHASFSLRLSCALVMWRTPCFYKPCNFPTSYSLQWKCIYPFPTYF